jgi:hypothetical protein
LLYLATLAVALGTGLGLWHLKATDNKSRPPLYAGLIHAIAGLVAFMALLIAVNGPPRGTASGAGSFGVMATVLFGLSLVTGAAALVRRRKAPTITLAVHSGLAITGYVLLLAWDSLS